MIRFSLPEFTINLRANLIFVALKHTFPQSFFDDIEIGSLYGCFPGCKMNGGRAYVLAPYSRKQIAETFDTIADAGLTVRLTFTNMLVGPDDFTDGYFNAILDAANTHGAEVIVYSDELRDYIVARHAFKTILSTTRMLKDVQELNGMLEQYNMVVLDYNHNKDDAYLRQVTEPARLEVMPNELCIPNCRMRQRHYEHNSRDQLRGEDTPFDGCKRHGAVFTTPDGTSPTILSNDDIRRLNREYGIENFKIVGRAATGQQWLEAYLYYLVRPEFHQEVRGMLQKELRINRE